MLRGDVPDVSEPFVPDTGDSCNVGDALQRGVSKGEADFAGDYAEHDGVLFEGVEGVSVLGAEGGLFSEFVRRGVPLPFLL